MTAEQTMGSGTYAPRRIAEIVAEICDGDPDDRIILHELLDLFEVRAFGFLVLVFALPNGIPAPIAPGLSAILGAPLLLLSGPMLLGFDHPWRSAEQTSELQSPMRNSSAAYCTHN